jgi:sugar/nucleoside kinase (ribokinase family)
MTDTIYDVCGIGNAIVDVLSFTEDAFLKEHSLAKGGMMLIDEARAEELYGFMESAAECSGGSVANSVAAIASLGGTPAFIGKVKSDQLGEIFRHDMRGVGVHFDTNPATSGAATARCLIFVTPDAQRTMNTYLGACTDVRVEDVNDALIAKSQVLYIEGYLWDQPHAKEAIRKAVDAAKKKGRKVALTLSDTFCVERHRADFFELIRRSVDILFANENEIKSLFEEETYETASWQAKGLCPIVVVTRGEKGAVVLLKDATIQVDAETIAEVMDTTGAGDLFAAGFLYGYTQGRGLMGCARLGNACAAHIIQQLGARSMKPLREVVEGI